MTTMLDAIRRTHPHLLTPRPMCEHCGVRRARVGVLCATCDEDPEERAAFLAALEYGKHAEVLESLGACRHCVTVPDAHGHCECIF